VTEPTTLHERPCRFNREIVLRERHGVLGLVGGVPVTRLAHAAGNRASPGGPRGEVLPSVGQGSAGRFLCRQIGLASRPLAKAEIAATPCC
jgi:hypothetical protein